MRYLVNNLQQPIFVSDIKKLVPYDPTMRKVFSLDDNLFERSSEIRGHISNGAVVDVTQQYVQQIAEAAAAGAVVSPYCGVAVGAPSQAPATQTTAASQGNGREGAYTMPRAPQGIMVDINESSRALGASDAHLHAAHINSGIRAGAETGLLVEPHDDPSVKQRLEASRSAYLVENDSKAAPKIDPRFQRSSGYDDVTPVNLLAATPVQAPVAAAPAVPMAHMYQNAQVQQRLATAATTEHTHGHNDRYDPNWGQNSALLQMRRATNPVSGMPHDHTRNNSGHEPLDPRMAANASVGSQPVLNPLLADDVVQTDSPVVGTESGLSAEINPLLADYPPATSRRIYDEPPVDEENGDDDLGEVTEVTVVEKPKKTRKPRAKKEKAEKTKKSGGKKSTTRRSSKSVSDDTDGAGT